MPSNLRTTSAGGAIFNSCRAAVRFYSAETGYSSIIVMGRGCRNSLIYPGGVIEDSKKLYVDEAKMDGMRQPMRQSGMPLHVVMRDIFKMITVYVFESVKHGGYSWLLFGGARIRITRASLSLFWCISKLLRTASRRRLTPGSDRKR